jgi:hypothetical protein
MENNEPEKRSQVPPLRNPLQPAEDTAPMQQPPKED